MNQEVFFQELRRVLQREGFTTQAVQDGLLPVEWDGHPLCQISEGASTRYTHTNVDTPERELACQRATDLSCMVWEYTISLISSNKNWSLVDIYADEGITGTSVDKREDFKRLMADCRRGLVDRILVKSISRFARNTTECLEAIRELKALGVGVHFEKENIDTATMSGEMMTTLFASFAQAESESISSNMRWSYQKRMQRGEFITCSAPFGYHLHNGMLEIDEAEATVIRLIFDRYLSGISMAYIADEITQLGFPTRAGMPYRKDFPPESQLSTVHGKKHSHLPAYV